MTMIIPTNFARPQTAHARSMRIAYHDELRRMYPKNWCQITFARHSPDDEEVCKKERFSWGICREVVLIQPDACIEIVQN